MCDKIFNVAVIGLSGVDQNGVEYKVGKSLFCNRFVRPAHDDMVFEHPSVLDEGLITGLVVNNDTFLYWGSVCMRVFDDSVVKFNVVEQTHIRSDCVFSLSVSDYVAKSTTIKLSSPGKRMYMSEDQLKCPEKYAVVKMPDCSDFQIDGFILVYNAEPNINYSSAQTEFLSLASIELKKNKKPYLIAATKYDTLESSRDSSCSGPTDSHLSMIEKTLSVPVVETSAVCNVNVVMTFQLLYSIMDQKSKAKGIKVKCYSDAYRTITTRNTVLIESFSQLVLSKSNSISTTFSEFLSENKSSSKLKQALEVYGREGLSKLFLQCVEKKFKKIRDSLFQKYLDIFENNLSMLLPTFESFNFGELTPDNVINNIHRLPNYDDWFEVLPEQEDWDNSDRLCRYALLLENKKKDPFFSKIPTIILKTERCQVLLSKHLYKLSQISISCHLKNALESRLKELVCEGKFTIKSSIQDMESVLNEANEKQLAECLSCPTYKETFNEISQRLHLNAQADLHELLFEHADDLCYITFKSKSQLLEDFANVVGDDPRYKKFDGGLEQLRGNWIFQNFTYSCSSTHCVLSPIYTCCDQLAKSVLSGLAEQCRRFSPKDDDCMFNEEMVLFVLACENVYNDFESEFMNMVNQAKSNERNVFYVDGFPNRICLVKVTEVGVDWREVLDAHRDSKFSFLCIYGDANSYKFLETSLSKLYSVFHAGMHQKQELQAQDNSSLHEVEIIPSNNFSNFGVNMNNIAIMMCLRPHIVHNYRTFIARMDDCFFFQDSMLGRLIEQGRNLCSRYSAKLFQPFIGEILEKKMTRPMRDFQIRDSLFYLSETVSDVSKSLLKKHKDRSDVKIVVCCACGDNYPIEIVVAVLLSGRRFEYSHRHETLYFEHLPPDTKEPLLVSLEMMSYHSAMGSISKRSFHSCIMVFSSERKASSRIASKFICKCGINLVHVMGIKGLSSNASVQIQKSFDFSDKDSSCRRSAIETLSEVQPIMDIGTHLKLFRTFLDDCCSLALTSPLPLLWKNIITHDINIPRDSSCEDSSKYSTLQYYKRKPQTEKTTRKPSIRKNVMRNEHKKYDQLKSRGVSWAKNPAFEQAGLYTSDSASCSRSSFADDIADSGSIHSVNVVTPSSHADADDYQNDAGVKKKIRGIKNLKTATMRFLDKLAVSLNNQSNQLQITLSKTDEHHPAESAVPHSSECPLIVDLSKSKKSSLNILGSIKVKRRQMAKPTHEDRMLEWNKLRSADAKNARSSYFGRELADIPLIKGIPLFIIKCAFYIEENGLATEGIFRVSGNKNDIEVLKQTFELDNSRDFGSFGFTIHTISGALKSFLSSLPTTLIPQEFNCKILEAVGHANPEERISMIKGILAKLLDPNVATLSFLTNHLAKLSANKEKTKMDPRNLALCIWPSIMKDISSSLGVCTTNSVHFCLFMHILIENCANIFGESPVISTEDLPTPATDVSISTPSPPVSVLGIHPSVNSSNTSTTEK